MKISFVPAYQLSADAIRLRPDNSVGNFVLYALFAIMVMIVTLTGLISTAHSRYTDDIYHFSQYLTAGVSLILAIQTRKQIAHLAQIAKVLRTQQVPLRIWRENVRGILFELLKHTSIASTILATGFMFPYSPWSFAMPAVLISIVNSSVLVISLLHYGFFPGSKSSWILGSFFIVLIALSFDGRIPFFVSRINQLPAIVLIGLSLIWPLCLLALYRHLKIRIPASRKALSVKLWQGLLKHTQRYSVVTNMMGVHYKKGVVVSLSSLLTGAMQFGIFFPNIFDEVTSKEKTPSNLFVFFIYSLVLTSYLVVKDIHWRYFLLPGKVQQRKLANNMLMSSIEMQGGLLLIGVVAYQAIALLFDKDHFFAFVYSLPNYWLLPIECLFANVLAIFLASFNKPGKISTPKLILCLVMMTALIGLGIYFNNEHLFYVGPVYAACLLILSYLLMRINNRRWNGELLLMRVQGK